MMTSAPVGYIIMTLTQQNKNVQTAESWVSTSSTTGFAGFRRVSPNFIGFSANFDITHADFTGFPQVTHGFVRFRLLARRVSPSFAGLHRVSQCLLAFRKVSPGFVGFRWVSHGFARFRRVSKDFDI